MKGCSGAPVALPRQSWLCAVYSEPRASPSSSASPVWAAARNESAGQSRGAAGCPKGRRPMSASRAIARALLEPRQALYQLQYFFSFFSITSKNVLVQKLSVNNFRSGPYNSAYTKARCLDSNRPYSFIERRRSQHFLLSKTNALPPLKEARYLGGRAKGKQSQRMRFQHPDCMFLCPADLLGSHAAFLIGLGLVPPPPDA